MKDNEVQTARMGMIFLFVFMAYYMIQDYSANLYGATKRADELIAFSYHHLHRVHSVGLRLFTVYGPWGRPDMAAYIFSRAVELGQPLTV